MKIAASMSVGRLAPKHSLDIDGIRAISPNVTPSLIKDDVVIIDRLKQPDGSHMTIEEYTDQTFQPYIDQYNAKQRRKGRQIQTGYCEWHRSNGTLSQGKGELAYEAVLQYGSHENLGGEYYSPDTTPERKTQLRAEYEQVYRQWVADLERDFPHMTIVFAVAHFSETEGTPHLHVCMQPQADCTRGLSKQVSIGRALAQDGIERLDSREEAKRAGGYQLARFYQKFHHEYQNPSLQRLGYEIKAEQHGLRHMEKDGYALVIEQAEQKAEKIIQKSQNMAKIVENARRAAAEELDFLETKQLIAELEVEQATKAAEQAKQAAERAIQSKAEAEANEAAIRAQARYEAEATVRQLEAELNEKNGIIHSLSSECDKLKTKLSKLRQYLNEKHIMENFLQWIRSKSYQYEQVNEERER